MTFKEYCDKLEQKIEEAYESGVTIPEAEKLAAGFLSANNKVSDKLKDIDLDRRMRKSGVKAIRAAIKLDELDKAEKKPTESVLEALVDSNEIVQKQQEGFDNAEVEKEWLERKFKIFHEAHLYFRGISKGRFE